MNDWLIIDHIITNKKLEIPSLKMIRNNISDEYKSE